MYQPKVKMFRQPKSASSQSQSGGPSSRKATRTKSETCRYPNRVCSQPVLEQYEYCMKHILEDKNAPYKPCGYTYAINNKRCLQPALRGDKRDIGFCSQHVWRTGMKRQKAMTKRACPVTAESLLSSLSHYVRPAATETSSDFDENPDSPPTTMKAVNPFVDIEAGARRGTTLECGSESDSDVEPATLESVWNASNEQSSDAESTDSQLDDPLRHAGVYTAEEVILMTRNKMLKLQQLYRRQFERLAHILKEKRRKYLNSLKKEKETLSTISDQSRVSIKEQKLYEKLKALTRYQKRSALESVAYFASQEKKAKELCGANYKPLGHNTKCSYTEGGVRCSRVTLPLSKFCFKHILEDQNQCIFRACGCDKADTVCKDPVMSISEGDTCVLHIKLPILPHLNLPEEDETKEEVKTVKICDNESEFDASATESALSTDNHDVISMDTHDVSPSEEVVITSDAIKEVTIEETEVPPEIEKMEEPSVLETVEVEAPDEVT